MEGRRGRPPNSERQHTAGDSEGSGARRRKGRPPNVGHTEFPNPSEAKLLRKLEAQGNADPEHLHQTEMLRVLTEPSTSFLLCFRNRPAGCSDEADEEVGEAGARASS